MGRRRRWALVHHGFVRGLGRRTPERRTSRPGLEQERPDREHVGGWHHLALQLLGRHVPWGTEGLDGLTVAAYRRRDTEVDQADRALLVDQHVARGDVTVHDLRPPVRVIQRATGLDAEVGTFLGVERSGDGLLQPGVEAAVAQRGHGHPTGRGAVDPLAVEREEAGT